MNGGDKTWLQHPRHCDVYINEVRGFLRNAFPSNDVGVQMRYPCKKCQNQRWYGKDMIFEHLICKGVSPAFSQWVYEISMDSEYKNDDVDCHPSMLFGDDLDIMLKTTFLDFINCEQPPEGANAEARKFYRLVEEGKQPFYEGCNYSTLSFLVKFYQVKCTQGMTETCFTIVKKILKDIFPHASIPKSFNHAKNTIRDLGLDYQKIHAFPNDCMLYWDVNESEEACTTCGLSRWEVVDKKGVLGDPNHVDMTRKIPAKVMRYFPLKPRLQRMFLCKELSKLMRWHAVERENDGKLRHASGGEAWKAMDANYPQFSSEVRNVRLGLATDGFNPFRMMGTKHSTWPIVLVNYNLPPWLSMKAENLILSTLIPGPSSPGNNIDVYMQPLIAELKDLWNVGLETFDVLAADSFMLHASILWTINDFPGLGMVSGWHTKCIFACPPCNYETISMYLKHSQKISYMGHRKFLDASHKYRFDKRRFNGNNEMGKSPSVLSGRDIEILLSNCENEFGKKKRKRKSTEDSPWSKKSIFFEYLSDNLVRHNLDVMHIEKNLFDNIFGTLLNISGKTKDHLKARQDSQELGIRKPLHPKENDDYDDANFNMTKEQKETFCSILKSVKVHPILVVV